MKAYIKAVLKAWRPFSLTAAVIPTTIGSLVALSDNEFNIITFLLVTAGGLLIQSGVNLINDFFEFKSGILPEKNPQLALAFNDRMLFEYMIFLSGLACFGLTVPIGLYLAYKSGLQLLVIGMIGFVGGYFYTGKPFSYKDKALGVILVFFLMGVLMVYGSYYAFNPVFSLKAILISLPVSFLVSLLLISNEIRDIESDTANGLKTLSVCIGYHNSRILYLGVLLSAYLTIIPLVITNILPAASFITYITLPYGLKVYNMTNDKLPERRAIVPKTANIHFLFGCLLAGSLVLDIFI